MAHGTGEQYYIWVMKMRKIFMDRRFSGYIWHFLFAGLFIGLSLYISEYTKGVTWYLISSLLRIIFGITILIVSAGLFERKIPDILSFSKTKEAIFAGIGFLIFFLYDGFVVISGIGKITGLTTGILLSRIILQQATTGFYEELNYRFLLLEGLKYTEDKVGTKSMCVMISAILFGLLHCVTGWNTYTFFQTGAIGFAFAVIFVKSGNILIPMILHFVYDVIANTAGFVEWNHTSVFDNLSSIFPIMLAIMFVISAVILIVPEKKMRTGFLGDKK